MTREMNKPDWHSKWKIRTSGLHPCGYKFCQYYFMPEEEQCKKCLIKPKERVLNPDIKEFFDNCCRMEKIK